MLPTSPNESLLQKEAKMMKLEKLIAEVRELIAVLRRTGPEAEDPAQRLLDAVAEAQRTLETMRYDGPRSLSDSLSGRSERAEPGRDS